MLIFLSLVLLRNPMALGFVRLLGEKGEVEYNFWRSVKSINIINIGLIVVMCLSFYWSLEEQVGEIDRA